MGPRARPRSSRLSWSASPDTGTSSFSYTWLGNGLWSQEWGMFLLPLAWGSSWRAVHGVGRGKYALAALVVGLTIAMHLPDRLFRAALDRSVRDRGLARSPAAYRACRPGVWRSGAGRLVGRGAAARRAPHTSTTAFQPEHVLAQLVWGASGSSGGWSRASSSTMAGFPIVSLLVALGIAVCVSRFRSDVRARALLGLMAMSFVLFSGRPTFGFVINLLPGNADLFLLPIHDGYAARGRHARWRRACVGRSSSARARSHAGDRAFVWSRSPQD